MEKKEPIVVFGIPRSGSTWFAQVLASNGQYKYLHEPDNEKVNIMGYIAKNNLPRFPYLIGSSKDADYINLFKKALYGKFLTNESLANKALMKLLAVSPNSVEQELTGSKRHLTKYQKGLISTVNTFFGTKDKRVIKSVHGIMAVPVLIENLSFKPVFILRHPAAVVSSMLNLNMPDANRGIFEMREVMDDLQLIEASFQNLSDLEVMGLQIGIFYTYIHKAIEKYDIKAYQFEDVCIDVEKSFKAVYGELNIDWNEKVEAFIKLNNKPGSGYKTQRIASDQADKWKHQLRAEEIEQIKNGYQIIKPAFYNETWN